MEREREILMARVPELSETMADRIAKVVRSVRDLKLRKAPSVSESIDWARTLLALGAEDVSTGVTHDTLGVLLKYQEDIERAAKELQLSDGD